MTSEVSGPTRRLRREGSLHFSTVVLTCNGAQNFDSFRTGSRRPRSSDRPMNKFSRDHLPPDSHAKYIFEQGQVPLATYTQRAHTARRRSHARFRNNRLHRREQPAWMLTMRVLPLATHLAWQRSNEHCRLLSCFWACPPRCAKAGASLQAIPMPTARTIPNRCLIPIASSPSRKVKKLKLPKEGQFGDVPINHW